MVSLNLQSFQKFKNGKYYSRKLNRVIFSKQRTDSIWGFRVSTLSIQKSEKSKCYALIKVLKKKKY